MKRKKLNARGFSHDIALVLFVVVFAIGGVAYMVASRAYSCDEPVSGAVSYEVSGEVSGPVSEDCPVSEATSGPVSEGGKGGGKQPGQTPPIVPEHRRSEASVPTTSSATTSTSNVTTSTSATPTPAPARPQPAATSSSPNLAATTLQSTTAVVSGPAASCSITGVPSKPSYKQTITPVVRVTNTGSETIRPFMQLSFTYPSKNGFSTTTKTTKALALLPSRQSTSYNFDTYKVPFSTKQTTRITYSASSTAPKFSCSASATLPKSSVWSSFLGIFK